MANKVMRMETAAPSRKVVGATGGAGVGAAIAVVAIYLIEGPLGWGDIPGYVETAMTTLISAAFAYFVGYGTRPAARDAIVEDDTAAQGQGA